jgi:two-component system, response regulator FlrC
MRLRRMTSDVALVLYVEDNTFIRESVTELLQCAARQFISCDNAGDGLTVLKTQRVDLLITDLNLPGMTGMELVKRSLAAQPSCPVIICSGHDMSHAVFAAPARVECIRKPFDLEELEAALDRLLPSPHTK